MAFCPNCGTQNDDAATVCSNCGGPLVPKTAADAEAPAVEPAAQPAGAAPVPGPAPVAPQPAPQAAYPPPGPGYQTYQNPGVMPAPAPAYDIFDHTSEFDPADISANKCLALLPYLLSYIGIIIAALVGKDSGYVSFHLRQAIKFTVVNSLLIIAGAVLGFTVLVPVAAGVCLVIVFVLKVIAVFQIFGGKAVEPAIIRNLGFLN